MSNEVFPAFLFLNCNSFDGDKTLTAGEKPFALGEKQPSLVLLSITEAVIHYSTEVLSITSLILNSQSIKLGSLFQSLRGLTTPMVRCAYVLLHWTLFSRLENGLRNIMVSFISNFDDYLPDLPDRLNLLYTIQYFTQLFSSLQFFSSCRPWSASTVQTQLPFTGLPHSPHMSQPNDLSGEALTNRPRGASADITVVLPRFNEWLWLQFGPNLYLLAISAHIHKRYIFPVVF